MQALPPLFNPDQTWPSLHNTSQLQHGTALMELGDRPDVGALQPCHSYSDSSDTSTYLIEIPMPSLTFPPITAIHRRGKRETQARVGWKCDGSHLH
jgi:hypothetical protein